MCRLCYYFNRPPPFYHHALYSYFYFLSVYSRLRKGSYSMFPLFCKRKGRDDGRRGAYSSSWTDARQQESWARLLLFPARETTTATALFAVIKACRHVTFLTHIIMLVMIKKKERKSALITTKPKRKLSFSCMLTASIFNRRPFPMTWMESEKQKSTSKSIYFPFSSLLFFASRVYNASSNDAILA